MSKRLLAIIALSSLTVICCNNDTPDDVQFCSTTSVGTITTNLFEAQGDENQTHKDGFCLATEKCVTVLNSDGMKACSLNDQGFINCNGSILDATIDKNNCGQCGKTCSEGEFCSHGVCTCTEGSKQCTLNGDSRKCEGGSWNVTKCTDGCTSGECNEHICDADELKCSDNNSAILICKNNSWSTFENCSFKCGFENNMPVCVEKVCDEEEKKCLQENQAGVCTNNKWITQDCEDGCTNGQCDEHVCDADATMCSEDGSKLLICTKNAWTTLEPCDYKCGQIDDNTLGCIEKVCDENAQICVSPYASSICSENAWHDQGCNDGCSNNKCNDHVCDIGTVTCSNDATQVLTCVNNAWSSMTCAPNSNCVAGKCTCKSGYSDCDGSCVDLKTDKQHCGSCDIHSSSQGVDCIDSSLCVKNTEYYPPYAAGNVKRCCDADAIEYTYLLDKPQCKNDNSVQFVRLSSAYAYSLTYCLRPEDANAINNKDQCLIYSVNVDHLTNVNECGITAPYLPCTRRDSKGKLIDTCFLGRCCVPDGKYTNIPKSSPLTNSDCCSGYSYRFASSGGSFSGCTDDPDFCKNQYPECLNSSTCSCTMS